MANTETTSMDEVEIQVKETGSARLQGVKLAGGSPAPADDHGRTVPWIARTLHRLYNAQAQKTLNRENVSIAHWIYLRVLAERGQLTQRELSERAGIATQTAVPALDSLEKRGLVQRVRDPRDRRKYDVSLTAEGRSLIVRVMPEINAMFTESLTGISAEEMAVFWRVTHRITENLSATMSDEPILD